MSVARAEKRRAEQDAKLEALRERGVKHYKLHEGERPPSLPRLPKTKREMQMHLTGNHKEKFREPVNREERREWDKFWQMKGRGFTKPESTGKRF